MIHEGWVGGEHVLGLRTRARPRLGWSMDLELHHAGSAHRVLRDPADRHRAGRRQCDRRRRARRRPAGRAAQEGHPDRRARRAGAADRLRARGHASCCRSSGWCSPAGSCCCGSPGACTARSATRTKAPGRTRSAATSIRACKPRQELRQRRVGRRAGRRQHEPRQCARGRRRGAGASLCAGVRPGAVGAADGRRGQFHRALHRSLSLDRLGRACW